MGCDSRRKNFQLKNQRTVKVTMKNERKITCTKNSGFSFHMSFLLSLFLVFFVYHIVTVSASKQSKAVETWASELGRELYHMANIMTKVNELKSKYKEYNARVVEKGELMNNTRKSVGRMFRSKIDAVRCIAFTAEKASASLNHTSFNRTEELATLRYYSSKYSIIKNESDLSDGEWQNQTCSLKECSELQVIKKFRYSYIPMELSRDTHFYNISVNTNHSSVHVPTNVYDHSLNSLKVIKWTQELDDIFVKNYRADPALSWQYFGSETGILRHYPAKSWEDRDVTTDVDVYDCRKRSWYIETATCSKDIIILLDNSGSMYKFLSFLAELTIKSILDTFSNNDFFNIYTFSNLTAPLEPCFADELVQATPENIRVFKNKIKKLAPANYANESIIREAFEKAFGILKNYRDKRNCNESTCNQGIMYVADSFQGNYTDIFRELNRFPTENGTERIPVRIFTYLLGKEPNKVKEMKAMACENRGDFQHIQTLDEVAEKVLEYVKIIAAPLVLQNVKHPPTWTHAFKDVTYADELTSIPPGRKKANSLPPPRLMISVGVPVFNHSEEEDEPATPGLIGVASTDVPVEDIDKLSLPYKLGVNGYSFIVSNNGYVLYHPDLRPMHYFKFWINETNSIERYILKENYNSIDITEIEQLDGDDIVYNYLRPDLGGEKLKKLRELALSNQFGSLLNVPVRFYYDKMRRVARESYDYYFAPLNWTPFVLGLAIPSTYGQTFIEVGDEIENQKRLKTNISQWFLGENFKVHPDWVYCRYHYLEGHEFNTSELELLHFLERFNTGPVNMPMQYTEDLDDEIDPDDSDSTQPVCDRDTLDENGYYCNAELMQLLLFDAKITNESYATDWQFDSVEDKRLALEYNANLRFVATMSGLTRWQFICGENEVEGDLEFGDYYTKAVEETWYKAAVMQHKIDSESFVYSVPHDDKDDNKEIGEIKVTASHAIFRVDGVHEAPASVVGFQFEQRKMMERFKNITAKDNCDGCLRKCFTNDLNHVVDCLVVDNNGYIILSKDEEEVGRFFGEDYGPILEKLLVDGVFENTTVYDFQALCKNDDNSTSNANVILKPWNLLMNAIKWGIAEVALLLANVNIWVRGEDLTCDRAPPPPIIANVEIDEEDIVDFQSKEEEERSKFYPCDMKATLYMMQKTNTTHSTDDLKWTLFYSAIPHSNLLFVYAEDMPGSPTSKLKSYDASMKQVHYVNDFPCYKRNVNSLSTRPLTDCFTEHVNETQMNADYCSSSTTFKSDQTTFITSLTILFVSSTMLTLL